jgi:hypothetical protein
VQPQVLAWVRRLRVSFIIPRPVKLAWLSINKNAGGENQDLTTLLNGRTLTTRHGTSQNIYASFFLSLSELGLSGAASPNTAIHLTRHRRFTSPSENLLLTLFAAR